MTGRAILSTGELVGWTHAHLPLARQRRRPKHYADTRHACGDTPSIPLGVVETCELGPSRGFSYAIALQILRQRLGDR